MIWGCPVSARVSPIHMAQFKCLQIASTGECYALA